LTTDQRPQLERADLVGEGRDCSNTFGRKIAQGEGWAKTPPSVTLVF
jgi:hypothetical protein